MERYPDSVFKPIGVEERTYEGHMGFFKSFDLGYGKEPGEAPGNNNYIPIKIVDSDSVKNKAITTRHDIGYLIDRDAEVIARVITRKMHSDVVDIVQYSVREIIRNVIEHSESTKYGYCAQYWPKRNMVEFSIIDRGIGIRKSLSCNPHLEMTSDKDAIKLGLMPCISGKQYKGKRVDRNNPWANSGYGLYITSRICGNGGSFFIMSGDYGLLLNNRKRYDIHTSYQGTALRLQLNTDQLGSTADLIKKYADEGSDISKGYKNMKYISASIASQTLSRDFIK